jgi:hypothetical protein
MEQAVVPVTLTQPIDPAPSEARNCLPPASKSGKSALPASSVFVLYCPYWLKIRIFAFLKDGYYTEFTSKQHRKIRILLFSFHLNEEKT